MGPFLVFFFLLFSFCIYPIPAFCCVTSGAGNWYGLAANMAVIIIIIIIVIVKGVFAVFFSLLLALCVRVCVSVCVCVCERVCMCWGLEVDMLGGLVEGGGWLSRQ